MFINPSSNMKCFEYTSLIDFTYKFVRLCVLFWCKLINPYMSVVLTSVLSTLVISLRPEHSFENIWWSKANQEPTHRLFQIFYESMLSFKVVNISTICLDKICQVGSARLTNFVFFFFSFVFHFVVIQPEKLDKYQLKTGLPWVGSTHASQVAKVMVPALTLKRSIQIVPQLTLIRFICFLYKCVFLKT